MNGVFHELVHDATGWATGDTLRLEVRTVATNTARLTVYRNGSALFTHDDASHFIASGQPGIGLFATTAISLDDWRGGEAGGAAGAATPGASSAEDDFNRADGALGPNWTIDPVFGSGAAVTGNQVASPPSGGGAFFWTANSFGADQYLADQDHRRDRRLHRRGGAREGGAVAGLLAGRQGRRRVPVRLREGRVPPARPRPTGWATGDTLRLEVQTVATNTARLTVHRNGSPLFTYDDASHFIESGQPGIGLFAGAATSLDDWRGGGINIARDDFNRADGPLGPKWAADPAWGNGASVIAGNQVVSPLSNGGALFWGAQGFERRPVLADPDHRRHRGLGRGVGPGQDRPSAGLLAGRQG